MWQKDLDINEVRELRLQTNVFFGVGAIEKSSYVAQKLAEINVKKVIVITGKSAYKTTGAWDYVKQALEDAEIGYVNYDGVTPNPTVSQVDEATELAKNFGAQAVIAIGGGSAIDAGKSVAILIEYPDKNATQLYEGEFYAEKAVPIVAVNLTHGTGTEVDRFAVVSIPEKDFKPSIGCDCIYPFYSIDDPALMVKLPKEQTVYVSLDAVNHVIEAATTKTTSALSVMIAREVIGLVAKYLPLAIEESGNLEARYYLTYAALLAGTSFDNSFLHYTHALEHPLSGLKPELSHGLGLAILLPSVIKNIYPVKSKTLAYILEPITSGLKGIPDEASDASKQVENWLASVGINKKLADEGFSKEDIPKLVDLAFNTPSLGGLLSLAPTDATPDAVKAIYEGSF